MSFPAEAVQIDFEQGISYGHDQAYVSYPTVFPTVTFQLKENATLISKISEIGGVDPDAEYEFYLGINGFTKSKLDNGIQALSGDESLTIDLDEEDQRKIFETLDQQLREHLGKGCDDLLEEAKAKI